MICKKKGKVTQKCGWTVSGDIEIQQKISPYLTISHLISYTILQYPTGRVISHIAQTTWRRQLNLHLAEKQANNITTSFDKCAIILCKLSKAVCSRYISGPLVYHFHQPITLISFMMSQLIISGPINSCFMGNNFVGRCIDKRCCNRVDSTMVSEQVAAIFWPLLATATHMHKAIICTLPCCNNVLSISDMDS